MKNYFYLQRTDRRAICATLVVLAAAVGAMLYFNHKGKTSKTAATDSIKTQRPYNKTRTAERRPTVYYNTDSRTTELFTFDPNTADSTQLLRLGLSPWQVRNIYKYRAKGGIYRSPSDFARLYGLTKKQYEQLLPYIRISADYRPAAETYTETQPTTYVRDTLRYPTKIKPGEHIALNSADTSLLKRVPGIGSGFARAIVNYRKRLGGFYKVEQLMEISNFPKSALPYFTADAARCTRLNINELTLNQLRRHPYISFYQAKTIIDHRRLHGPITSLEQLSMYADFTPDVIEKLRNYISF